MRKITGFVLAFLLVFSLTACGGGGESAGEILGHEVHTEDVMNGPKTKSIGKCAYIEMDRSELDGLSQNQWVEVFEAVNELDYNYFSIVCGDGTGVVFPGCSITASVGEMDDTGSIVKSEKDLTYSDGKVYETKHDIDVDAISKALADNTDEQYRNGSNFQAYALDESDNTISVSYSIDQGNDDKDSALSIATEYYSISEKVAKDFGVKLGQYDIVVTNKGVPVNWYITNDGVNYTVTNNGKTSEISVK